MGLLPLMYYFFIICTIYFTIFFSLIYIETYDLYYNDKPAKKEKLISILIPAYNEGKNVEESIKSILNSDYSKDKIEIIAINDGSTDNTLNILKSWQKKYPKIIKIINQENQGKAVALNNGLKIAKGEFIGVVDADSFLDKNALKMIMGVFENHPDTSAVTSNIQIKQKDNFLRKMQDIEYTTILWVRKLLQFIGAIYVTPGPLSVYKASVLRKVGGFDEKNITEDIEIGWRLLSQGHKIRICLNAVVYTNAPKKLKEWWRQRVRWSAGGYQTALKYKESLFKHKKYGIVGKFVFPFFSLSFIISLLGFSIVIYRFITESIPRIYYSIIARFAKPPSVIEYVTIPNSFTFFGILLLVASIVYTTISLLGIKNKRYFNLNKGGVLIILATLTFYLSLFPIVLIQGIYRVNKGVWKW